MLATDAATAAATWRPARYGDRRAASIEDPVIEPLWTGPRILAFVDRSAVQLTDSDGAVVSGHDEVRTALVEATSGATALYEAFLTPEPLRTTGGIGSRDLVAPPNPAQAMSQMLMGTRGERRARLERKQDEAHRRTLEGSGEEVALVVVDLLWLDDESLCDVPLLERKRILESAIEESELIRVGIHVKPPVDAWLGSWRTFGFRRLSYRAANSRYVPGQKNQAWATAEIPAR